MTAKICPSEAATTGLKIWKSIKLGTGPRTAGDFRRALRDDEVMVSERASDMLGESAFTVADEEIVVELVLVTVAELGFKNGVRWDLYKPVEKLGLELCPPEVGPQLRLQYLDQPNKEWINVAMKPFLDSGGNLKVFSVVRDDFKLCLFSDGGYPGQFWYPDSQWVWVLRHPRKTVLAL